MRKSRGSLLYEFGMRISNEDIHKLEQLRRIRNIILHGIETLPENYLAENFKSLKRLTLKVIGVIQDEDTKEQLSKEVDEL